METLKQTTNQQIPRKMDGSWWFYVLTHCSPFANPLFTKYSTILHSLFPAQSPIFEPAMESFKTHYHQTFVEFIYTLWQFNIAIENGPAEVVSFPINSMVDIDK